MSKNELFLDGSSLTPQEVFAFVHSNKGRVVLDQAALKNTIKSKDFLDAEARTKIIYGVNTGFGPMASHIIGEEQLHELQINLIRSHAVGMGKPINEAFVLAVMVVRLNTLMKGYSGLSVDLLERMRDFINHRIIPVVPEHGSVGASGDLIQLAHIALALIGEGEVIYRGVRQSTRKALQKVELTVQYSLQPKEGLALVNGTTCMAGIATSLHAHSSYLLNLATVSGAWSLELVGAYSDSIAELLHTVRPHKGQVAIAQRLRDILASSDMIIDRAHLWNKETLGEDVREIDREVQQVYSFRCIPQILGPIFETVHRVGEVVEVEINSVTDNPVIDTKQKTFLHGGNFHGDYIASSVDQLKAALTRLTMLSERRTNFFLNRNVNKRFPPFANLKKPGLTLGLQGLQFVATSTTAQSQSLAYPHHLHSISTNADNQDVVSMGTDAALFAHKVVENAYTVLSIELLTLAQITDHLNCVNDLSTAARERYTFVREHIPKIKKDRILNTQLNSLEKALMQEIVYKGKP